MNILTLKTILVKLNFIITGFSPGRDSVTLPRCLNQEVEASTFLFFGGAFYSFGAPSFSFLPGFFFLGKIFSSLYSSLPVFSGFQPSKNGSESFKKEVLFLISLNVIDKTPVPRGNEGLK